MYMMKFNLKILKSLIINSYLKKINSFECLNK